MGGAAGSDGLVFSGTVLAIARLTPETIKVTIRDTGGNALDTLLPFSLKDRQIKLPFNVDELVTLKIAKTDMTMDQVENIAYRPEHDR